MKFPDSDFKQQTLSPPRPKPLTGLGATLKSRAPARSNWPNVLAGKQDARRALRFRCESHSPMPAGSSIEERRQSCGKQTS